MSNLIERQAAKDYIDSQKGRPFIGCTIGEAMKIMLDEVPSARQWIPCTPETMPKMTDIYLVKVGINQYGEGMYPTFRTALWHTASRKWFVHESENSIIGEVTEWMPLPTPYREGGQDNGSD